jgi:calcineurin-like phosphoesterase family protein
MKKIEKNFLKFLSSDESCKKVTYIVGNNETIGSSKPGDKYEAYLVMSVPDENIVLLYFPSNNKKDECASLSWAQVTKQDSVYKRYGDDNNYRNMSE